jgi:hypothetical protein
MFIFSFTQRRCEASTKAQGRLISMQRSWHMEPWMANSPKYTI